jgi:ketosteroid isomerase-like protein
MSRERNIEIANMLLEGIGSGRDPSHIAASFAQDLVFEIQGDDEVLPWVGHKSGREAIAAFMRNQRALTEPLAFDVEDVLASETRAVVVGMLRTRIKATNRIVATQFALVLTIADDLVTRFQMLEDSYAVSQAARM